MYLPGQRQRLHTTFTVALGPPFSLYEQLLTLRYTTGRVCAWLLCAGHPGLLELVTIHERCESPQRGEVDRLYTFTT